ncbi:MAG: membrane-binding protein [Bacteroidota bacterium]|nr:membrane-binding protein [Bacteroidota bacterium]
MKNQVLFTLFSLFLSGAVTAQTGRLGEHSNITQWTVPANSFTTAAQGKEIAERIIDVVGLRTNFEIRPANIGNAAAVVYGGKRYILYDPTFINNLIKTTGTEWAAISVLAHEIGHHLNGHTISASGSQPDLELEADEFSGYVLRKMGAGLTESQAAMQTLASNRASRTHPAKYDRLIAIEQGWSRADDQIAGRSADRKEPAIAQRSMEPAISTSDVASNTNQVKLDPRYILGDVYFAADPSTRYHVTTNYNLVKVGQEGLRVLGKLARLNSSRFPYVIYDAQNTQLLVDARGKIVTPNGKQVGLLKNHIS